MKLNQKQKHVIKCVQMATGVENILITNRKREQVDARRIAYIIYRDVYKMTYVEIGKIFNKDHATVMFGYKSGKQLLDYDKEFKKNYYESISAVGGKGDRMMAIVEKIKELEEEFLTLQKLDYGL
jgi:chromosomal replication initiation ATPase DnaA